MTTASLTFVMVHGAFLTGTMWQQSADAGRGEGHIVHTPTLAGPPSGRSDGADTR